MNDELKQTVHLIRRGKVTTDDRGRTVWDGPVEEAELELVSTVMLKRILTDDDAASRQKLEQAVCEKDGVLARDPQTNDFEIVTDDDASEALLERADTDDELSLVSTMALKRILHKDDDTVDGDSDSETDESGFDPYNNA